MSLEKTKLRIYCLVIISHLRWDLWSWSWFTTTGLVVSISNDSPAKKKGKRFHQFPFRKIAKTDLMKLQLRFVNTVMSISRNRLAHYHVFQSNWITFSETAKHGGCPQGEAGRRGGWGVGIRLIRKRKWEHTRGRGGKIPREENLQFRCPEMARNASKTITK